MLGSIRRECLDYVIILNERHLRKTLSSYFDYYNRWRVHRTLEVDSPDSWAVQYSELGNVIEFPDVGGLHHHYERRAA